MLMLCFIIIVVVGSTFHWNQNVFNFNCLVGFNHYIKRELITIPLDHIYNYQI